VFNGLQFHSDSQILMEQQQKESMESREAPEQYN
jgi:hypothetical protein